MKKVAIRERIVTHLLNVDSDLAAQVADGLGINPLPSPAEAAQPTREDLPASEALSILKNGPDNFKGRKLGVLLTEGVDSDLLSTLIKEFQAGGAMVETVSLHAGVIKDSQSKSIRVDHKIDGGPSVLFDAVAVIPGPNGVKALQALPPALNFINDAFNHKKFIAYVREAEPLLSDAGVKWSQDSGCQQLTDKESVENFLTSCADLRFWGRG